MGHGSAHCELRQVRDIVMATVTRAFAVLAAAALRVVSVLCFVAPTFVVATVASGQTVGSSVGTADIRSAMTPQAGRVAYIDPVAAKIVEIDLKGTVTWVYAIPSDVVGDGSLRHGADIEWVEKTDTFLFVVPLSGIFEVDRGGQIVWRHKTRKVSHDADRLDNGNTIFVNAWDAITDPTVVEIDRAGNVVFQWYAGKHFGTDCRPCKGTVEGALSSYTHVNGVTRMPSGALMVSLRNMNSVVWLRDGKIVRHIRQLVRVHDPYFDGTDLYYASRGRPHGFVRRSRDGTKTLLVDFDRLGLDYGRTNEKLRNGNFLITESRSLHQITANGRFVWSIRLDGFASQRDGKRRSGSPFVYKAAFVYR